MPSSTFETGGDAQPYFDCIDSRQDNIYYSGSKDLNMQLKGILMGDPRASENFLMPKLGRVNSDRKFPKRILWMILHYVTCLNGRSRDQQGSSQQPGCRK